MRIFGEVAGLGSEGSRPDGEGVNEDSARDGLPAPPSSSENDGAGEASGAALFRRGTSRGRRIRIILLLDWRRRGPVATFAAPPRDVAPFPSSSILARRCRTFPPSSRHPLRSLASLLWSISPPPVVIKEKGGPGKEKVRDGNGEEGSPAGRREELDTAKGARTEANEEVRAAGAGAKLSAEPSSKRSRCRRKGETRRDAGQTPWTEERGTRRHPTEAGGRFHWDWWEVPQADRSLRRVCRKGLRGGRDASGLEMWLKMPTEHYETFQDD